MLVLWSDYYYYYFTHHEFFISALTGIFSLKFEWQQISSNLQISSNNLSWFWQCRGLSGLDSSSDFHFTQTSSLVLRHSFKDSKYITNHRHFHIPHVQLSNKVQIFFPVFHFLWFSPISDVLLHMDEQKQDDQLETTYSSSVPIRDVVLKTYRKQWTIEKGNEKRSGISVLMARHDDDYYYFHSVVCWNVKIYKLTNSFCYQNLVWSFGLNWIIYSYYKVLEDFMCVDHSLVWYNFSFLHSSLWIISPLIRYYFCIPFVYVFTHPSALEGCNTRSIFKINCFRFWVFILLDWLPNQG